MGPIQGPIPTSPIHVLATFDTHDQVLAAACHIVSWLIISPEAAHRALLPSLTHVQLTHTLKRLDDITLDEAKDVIRKLADERERLLDSKFYHSAAPPPPDRL